LTRATAGGIYPALTMGIGFDFGRGAASVFHGVRLALYGSAGTEPRVVRAEQTTGKLYGAAGFSLDVSLGSRSAPE
jgi:hypothetical protein